jgi:hypothetical protein
MIEVDQLNRIEGRAGTLCDPRGQVPSYLKLSGCTVGLDQFQRQAVDRGMRRCQIRKDVHDGLKKFSP